MRRFSRMDTPIAMFARGHVRPDRKQEVVDLLRERVKLTESEPGTLVHVCHFEVDNPNVFWEYFVFESRDALKVHREFHAKMEGFIETLIEDFSVWPVTTICEPLFAKGVALP